MNSFELEDKLAPSLEALGLFCFGWFVMADAPFTGRKAVLIGNRAHGEAHEMWSAFAASPEFADGQADPLNRWTENAVGSVAEQFDAAAVYPFGETVWPFQRYAKAATGMRSSPLGLLIHPEYGLWQAFRAVLIFGEHVILDAPPSLAHPCDTCVEKPCLSACPVNAFSGDGFAVEACRDHVASGQQPECLTLGCRARAACPIGVSYGDEQIRFHMKAFSK